MNKYYFINKFDTKNIDKQTLNTGIIYRNYDEEDSLKTVIKLKNYCKKKGHKFFLSNNVKLAINLNLDGAYIPSFNKNSSHLSFSKSKNFLLLGSAHNNKEIKIKEKQNDSLQIYFFNLMIFINSQSVRRNDPDDHGHLFCEFSREFEVDTDPSL